MNVETPAYGEAWFQCRPGYDFLLGEMLDYAEATLVDKKGNTLGIYVDDPAESLQTLLLERGYHQNEDHPDPSEWTTPSEYENVQKEPDYREDLDLYVKGSDGEYVSCCIVWYDESSRLGIFEPVCIHADFRRKGFGRAVLLEGIRRIAALGGEKVRVGSGQHFYKAIGFQREYMRYRWTKRFCA